MFSNFVSFEEIVELVKDDTGIYNLTHLYPKLRRFIYRAEKDIGFGGSAILKRLTYSVNGGSIANDGTRHKIRLPEDILYLEDVGMCHEGICPGDYEIQGKWMFFKPGKKVEEFSLLYYTLLEDGNGNPAVSENHSEAVVAGIVYWLYNSRRFKDKGSIQQSREYKNDYYERIAEARGDDATPNTEAEWKKLSQIMNMSSTEALLYIPETKCYMAVPDSEIPVYSPEDGMLMTSSGTKLSLPTGEISGNTQGEGTGASTIGDGSYPDPNEPAPNPDTEPEPEEGNQPPTIQDVEVTVAPGVVTVITLETIEGNAGFPYSDPENDALAEVRVDAIYPYNSGTFFYNGTPIYKNLVITRQDLIEEKLTHIGGNIDSNTTDSFSFSVRDGVNENWIS